MLNNIHVKMGIYCILNIKNNKRYIGQSVDIFQRRQQHFNKLSRNRHCNTHLQNAYNKYGKENFRFFILEYCDNRELLDEREQAYIDYYDFNRLYNICKIASAPPVHNISKVAQVDPNTGKVLNVYESIKEATIAVDLKHHSSISKVCAGDRKTAKGYYWKYV